METTDINHGNLDTISYDNITRELHVHFNDGDYVIYYEVYDLDYMGLLSSTNKSNYFKERISPRFPSKKVIT